MNRTFGKTICVLVAFFMVLAVACGSYVANAKETQQSLQNKIDNAQEQIDENNEKKKNIEGDMSDLEDQIKDAEAEVSALEAEVADANAQLQQTADDLEESEEDLGDRLRTMYKSGSMGFIDVLFSSENVSELMNNFSIVQYIFKNDKDIVSDLEAKQSELNAKQEALGDSYSQLASAKKEVNAENADLQEQIDQWQADSAAIAAQINNAQQGGGGYQPPAGSVSSSGFAWPVPGHSRVSSEYGWRMLNGKSDFHLGIDIPAPTGTPVVAAKDGMVIATGGQHWSYGNIVIIDHGNGVATAYAHNSSILVSDGQIVKRGQTIALAGNTGNSFGSHCHFEVRINGHTVNPRNYL